MVSRLTVQRVLGGLWFVDGLLQLKPEMFTRQFTARVILPAAAGQPHWLASLIRWGAAMATPHIALCNLAFAGIQLALGTLLLLDRCRRWSLAASVAWGLFVWIFGEGLGGLLAGNALTLSGAPGAGLLYGLASVAVWPAGTAQGWAPWAARFGQISLAGVWLVGCALLGAPGALASALAFPWALHAIQPIAVTFRGVLFGVQGALGVALLTGGRAAWPVRASIILALLFWWLGQDFGQVWTPLGTDLNSGPLVMLLALAAAPDTIGPGVSGRRRRRNSWNDGDIGGRPA